MKITEMISRTFAMFGVIGLLAGPVAWAQFKAPPGAGFTAADALSATGWTSDGTTTTTTKAVQLPATGVVRFGAPGTAALIYDSAVGWELDSSSGAAAMTIANGGAVTAPNGLAVSSGFNVLGASPNVLRSAGSPLINLNEATGGGSIEVSVAAGGRFRAVAPTYFDGNEGNAARRGTVTLSGGTGTATVNANALCTCQDTNNSATPITRCNVSTTTLTITAALDHVIAYHCQ